MKFFIVGAQGTGKRELLEYIQQDHPEMHIAKLFSNVNPEQKGLYRNIEDYVTCDEQDIRAVFENNAYLFMNGVDEISYNIFEGISLREFDESDVVMLTPDEMIRIPNMDLGDNICFIWLDNNTKNRFNRYKSKKLNYSFQQRADVEKQCMNDFISSIYSFPNSKLLYFYNEDPGRISAIIYALYKDNTLIDEFAKKFN